MLFGALIGGEGPSRLHRFGQSRVVKAEWLAGAVPAPPLNHFLKKGIFRAGGKEMAIQIAGLGIKKDKDWHGCGFGNGIFFHVRLLSLPGKLVSVGLYGLVGILREDLRGGGIRRLGVFSEGK